MPLGMEVGLGQGDIVLERGTAASTFRPICIVAKRSPISAVAELLYPFDRYDVGPKNLKLNGSCDPDQALRGLAAQDLL